MTEEQINQSVVIYQCGICSEHFNEEELCLDHFAQHNYEDSDVKVESEESEGGKDADCPSTIIKFATKRKYNTNGPFPCKICGIEFKMHCNLELHSIKHSDNRPHKCDLCGVAFKRGSHLTRHRNSHFKEKSSKFQCPSCYVEYVDGKLLSEHYRVHHLQNDPDSSVLDSLGKAIPVVVRPEPSPLPIVAPKNKTDFSSFSIKRLHKYVAKRKVFQKYYFEFGPACHVITVPIESIGGFSVGVDGTDFMVEVADDGCLDDDPVVSLKIREIPEAEGKKTEELKTGLDYYAVSINPANTQESDSEEITVKSEEGELETVHMPVGQLGADKACKYLQITYQLTDTEQKRTDAEKKQSDTGQELELEQSNLSETEHSNLSETEQKLSETVPNLLKIELNKSEIRKKPENTTVHLIKTEHNMSEKIEQNVAETEQKQSDEVDDHNISETEHSLIKTEDKQSQTELDKSETESNEITKRKRGRPSRKCKRKTKNCIQAVPSKKNNKVAQASIRCSTGRCYWRCDVCKEVFKDVTDLRLHSKSHTVPKAMIGEKLFSCVLCEQGYREIASLRCHMQLHNVENVHTCKTCGRIFNRPGLMVKHMMIHTGEKPHKCDVCSKFFRTVSLLKRHAMMHSGVKPHVCPACLKTYSDSSSRNIHMRKHHPGVKVPLKRGSPRCQ